jgi:hypothetical protein
MSTKTLVLHIGDPKTGSSSIQQALFQRRVECTSVLIDYPPKLNSIQLANSMRRASQAEEREDRFRAVANWLDASDGDVAVLSAEQFASIDPTDVNEIFARHMPNHAAEMRVVAYARPHVSRFLSAYAQRVKVGSLQSDVETFFRENTGKRFLNFSRRFRKWRNLYGDRFVLRPMVREELRNGDVVADFIGIVVQNAPFRLLDVAAANTTLPVEALSGLKYLQKHLAAHGLPGGTLHHVGSQINRICGAVEGAKGTKLRIGRDLYDRICEIARSDAEKLDETFFGRSVMVKAMDEAALETIDKTMETDARAYFSSQDLAKLAELGTALAGLFAAQPDLWKETFDRRIGQKIDAVDNEDLPAEAISHIVQVDRILDESAALICRV